MPPLTGKPMGSPHAPSFLRSVDCGFVNFAVGDADACGHKTDRPPSSSAWCDRDLELLVTKQQLSFGTILTIILSVRRTVMSLGAAARPLAVIDESREAGTAVLTGRQIECTIIHNGNTDLQITLPSDVTVPDRFRIRFSVSQREALAELDWQEGSTARIRLLTAPKPIRLPRRALTRTTARQEDKAKQSV